MVIICQLNLKGGVGKTTNTVHVGAELASRGKKVLLIDADPQCDLSFATGIYESSYTITDFLKTKPGFRLKQKSNNFFILPGDQNFDASDYKQSDLKKAIHGKCYNDSGNSFFIKEHFDYIFIDVPPQKISKNYVTSTELALIASDYFITCLFPEPLSVKNLNSFLTDVFDVKQKFNKKLKFAGIYFGNVLVTRSAVENYKNEVMEVSNGLLYDSFVRQDAEVVTACGKGKTIFQYKPNCRAAKDYIELTDEILKSIKNV